MSFPAALPVFREVFSTNSKELLQWFPGHMGKGMKKMQEKLRSVDGIIEVHDARVPFSGRNKLFKEKINMVRPHILVLNKIDLADLTKKEKIVERLKSDGISEVIFTDCLHSQDKAVNAIIPKAIEMIKAGPRYDRGFSSPSAYTLMIIGIPNVGKSSLINVLRRIYMKKYNKAAPVGALPGMTRAVQTEITISERPRVQVLDTPGIAHPNIKDVTAGLKLALCNVLQDHLVGEEIIVDFLLFWMNKRRDFRYVEALQLPGPTDNVAEVLLHVAKQTGKYNRIRPTSGGPWVERPDFLSAAKHILPIFRLGKMGKFMLDDEQLDPYVRLLPHLHPENQEKRT